MGEVHDEGNEQECFTFWNEPSATSPRVHTRRLDGRDMIRLDCSHVRSKRPCQRQNGSAAKKRGYRPCPFGLAWGCLTLAFPTLP
jgi:hypothetical protein